ncbi:MAG: hypothetical protein U0Q16_15710 [Bryobacteraceae bacterium]
MKYPLFFIFSGALLLGQSDGILGSASREVNLPPEEVELRLTLLGRAADFTLDNALRFAGEIGLTAQNLSGAGADPRGGYVFPGVPLPLAMGEGPIASYTFRAVFPFARVRELKERIAGAEKKLPEGVHPVSEFSTRPAEKTLDAVKQRLWPELAAEARRRAELLAAAANVRLGAMMSVSESVPAFASPAGGLLESPLQYVLTVYIRYSVAP